jgi:hypothetical protein
MQEFDSVKNVFFIWLMNLTALVMAFIPLLQFVAVILAIIASVTTIIINFQKIKNLFK